MGMCELTQDELGFIKSRKFRVQQLLWLHITVFIIAGANMEGMESSKLMAKRIPYFSSLLVQLEGFVQSWATCWVCQYLG